MPNALHLPLLLSFLINFHNVNHNPLLPFLLYNLSTLTTLSSNLSLLASLHKIHAAARCTPGRPPLGPSSPPPPPPPSSHMGNCICMQGLDGRSKKRVVSSGGGDSVKPFLENTATVHPLTAESSDEDKKTTTTGEPKVVRLKVVLTKAEAAQLLASGTVVAASEKMSPAMSMLEQLAAELERLGYDDRSHNHQNSCGSCAWRPALESIPELL